MITCRTVGLFGNRAISTSATLNKTFYDLLGIPQNASKQELRDAYNLLTKNYHPFTATREDVDKNERIHAAYDVLRDNERRQRYDQILERNNSFGRSKNTSTVDQQPSFKY